MNTCDACKHYTPVVNPHGPTWSHRNCGECWLTNQPDPTDRLSFVAVDKIASMSGDGGGSELYVGPKFGCIHWEAKS